MSANANKANDGSNPDSKATGSKKAGSKTYTTQSIASYYQLLGLKPNASVQEIRRAYRDLSKLYHPDTTALESAIAVPKFQALNEAYATLSSPEKRLSYDYKVGYSRLSVMQPLSDQKPQGQTNTGKHDWSASAYLDPNDRPLSAGEMFALFILGVTFIGCLVLVIVIGLTQDDLDVPDLEMLTNSERTIIEGESAITAPATAQASQNPIRSERPTSDWLVRQAPDIPNT